MFKWHTIPRFHSYQIKSRYCPFITINQHVITRTKILKHCKRKANEVQAQLMTNFYWVDGISQIQFVGTCIARRSKSSQRQHDEVEHSVRRSQFRTRSRSVVGSGRRQLSFQDCPVFPRSGLKRRHILNSSCDDDAASQPADKISYKCKETFHFIATCKAHHSWHIKWQKLMSSTQVCRYNM